MGTAVYVALERDLSTELDGESIASGVFPRNGKTLSMNLEALEQLSKSRGLRTIYEFVSGEGDEAFMPDDFQTEWFLPGEFLPIVEVYREHVAQAPRAYADAPRLLEDLDVVQKVLEAARAEEVRFYLGLDL